MILILLVKVIHVLLYILESWKDNPDFTQYLTELTSSNLDRLSMYILSIFPAA